MAGTGSDWLLGDVGTKKPKPQKRIPKEENLDFDAVEAFLSTKEDGKKLRAGLGGVVTALDNLKVSGLTGEALVVLVTAKCTNAANGKAISDDTVRRVLEALFRLGEYVR